MATVVRQGSPREVIEQGEPVVNLPGLRGRQFLRLEEVAAYFGISPRTAYRWIEKGLLPAYKVGGCLRVKVVDLQQFEQDARLE